jgi:hypothetical protein
MFFLGFSCHEKFVQERLVGFYVFRALALTPDGTTSPPYRKFYWHVLCFIGVSEQLFHDVEHLGATRFRVLRMSLNDEVHPAFD